MKSDLVIEKLSKTYDRTPTGDAAVSNLSLAIASGEFVTLLGPSGCGKTTTLRLIAGYLAPDSGTIAVGGRLMSSARGVVPPEDRGMGMVFQNYAVWPHKTVFENVVFGLKLRKLTRAEARRRVEQALAAMNLSGLEHRYPNELSGGQQQRVALARSLVVEPSVLLLDEPLSNLDAKLRERMRSELKQLQRRTGITFVYVTHDQSEALALSDRVAVLDRGRLQQYGTPREVYTRPANRVVADFMGLVNLIPARVAGAGTVQLGGLSLAIAPPDGTAAGALVDLAVRPECIRLTMDGPASSTLAARVEDRSYLGNLNEYVVALADGVRLRVQAAPDAPDFAVGSEVRLSIDARQCNVFPHTAGGGSPA